MKLNSEENIKILKIKLTLKYTIITVSIVILLIFMFYVTFYQLAYKNFDLMLENRAISIASKFVGEEESAIEDLKSISSIVKNYSLENEIMMIIDYKGNIIYENTSQNVKIPKVVKTGFYTIKNNEKEIIRIYITNISNTDYFVLIAMNYNTLNSSLKNIIISFLISIPFILLVTIFFSYRFANNAIKPLEESIIKLRQFTSDVSHELKTPISAIKANIEVALMKERDSTYYKEKLEKILEPVNRMSKLIQNMLFISSLDTGIFPINTEFIRLKEVLENLKSNFEGLILRKNINLIIDESNDIIIKTDKDVIFNILSIIIENGIQYNKENGYIKIYTEKEDSFTKINIEDSGIGIEESDIPYIFDRFYRGEKSRSKDTGGFGLGLSIAKKLAQLIGGDIQVKSELGNGSKFTITLRGGEVLK